MLGPVWLSSTCDPAPVNTHEAKSRLSELIRKAEKGDEVIVARNGEIVAKIIAWPERKPTRTFGSWKGRIHVHDDDIICSDTVADFDESVARPLP